MDASKNLCNKEHQFLLEKKQRGKVSCVRILKFVDLIGNHHLFQIFHTLLYVTNSFCHGEHQMFWKRRTWISGFLRKHINIWLTY